MNNWLRENLVCPRDQQRLFFSEQRATCPEGHEYPVVGGIPVMLLRDAIPTALLRARGTLELWRQAVTVFVSNVAAEIEAMRTLTVTERARVEDEVKRETDARHLPERVSAYDFVNAVTAMAHDAEPARRLEIEEFAGGLLRRHVGRA